MLTVFGHRTAKEMLEAYLPQVSIVMGPESVGKHTLARYIAQFHGVRPVDLKEISGPLTAEDSASIRSFMRVAPHGSFKLAIVHADGASVPALNDLLTLLESPPAFSRFILIASRPTLATVLSRCHRFNLGYLDPPDLIEILVRFCGVKPEGAKKVAALGQVSKALEAYRNVAGIAAAVAVIRAAESRDVLTFKRAFKVIDDDAADLIYAALLEAASGQWEIFSPTDFQIINSRPDVARMILNSWAELSSARRSLSARVVLEPVVRRP